MTSALARSTNATPARRPAGPTRHVYDAVVIGGQLSGALAAALLAKRGLQVLLVEHQACDGHYEHGGWRLPLTPGLFPPLAEEAVFDELLTELALHTSVHRALRPVSVQLIAPRQRLELAHDGPGRIAELTRAGFSTKPIDEALEHLRVSAKRADAFFLEPRELPPAGLWARWQTKRAINKAVGLSETPQLPTAPEPLGRLAALAPLACWLASPTELAGVRAVERLATEPFTYPLGRDGLRQTLADRATELGADVVPATDASAAAIVFEGGKPAGVRLTKGDTVYRAGCVIAACDVPALLQLLPENRRAALDKLSPVLELERALFTHHVIVPPKALPRGLGEVALVQTNDTELSTIAVHLTPARRAGSPDESKERLLTMHAVAPLRLKAGGEPAVNAFAQRLWESLGELLPFTRQHAVLESSVWAEHQPVVLGQLDPWPLYQLHDGLLGVAGLPVRTPHARLFLASRQVLPGLGFEGEVLAVRQAVNAAQALSKKGQSLKSERASA